MNSTPASLRQRARALAKLEQAQNLISAAAQDLCPVVPWGDGPWQWVGDHYDATKALWHRINNAPMPERLDSEPVSPPKDHKPLDLKKSTRNP